MFIADTFWIHLCWTIEFWGRCKVKISGDRIPERETVIIMANHRWFLDWLMFFLVAARKGRLGCVKLFAKASIRWIPGFGWGMWILDFPFLHRNWADDIPQINKTFFALKNRKLPFWLISHLEGTRISAKKLKESQDFAKKRDLPVLQNCLLPRKKGFISTILGLRDSVTAVYDFTIVYNDGKEYQPSLIPIILRQGITINIHIRRYPIKDVPDEKELGDWLIQRWKEKDDLIGELIKNGEFPNQLDEPYRHLPMNIK